MKTKGDTSAVNGLRPFRCPQWTACWLLAVGIAVGPAGCKHAPSSEGKPPATKRKPAQRGTQVVPVDEISGRVASVSPLYGFVVIDFYLSRLPQVGQKLGVYRQGLKVGEVKISSWERSQIVAADLVAGQANVGDQVRME